MDTKRLWLPNSYTNVDMERKAYEFIPLGVQGRAQRPTADIEGLQNVYAKNEIVYAAINLKATALAAARLMVQTKNKKGIWEEIDGHPFRRLMMQPNPEMSEGDLMEAWEASSDTSGLFYAEIVYGQNGLPLELHPLNPAKISTVPGPKGVKEYLFRDGSYEEKLPPERVLVKRRFDPRNKWNGLSPLSVALGAVDADNAQTDFIRAFFNNAGVPSGLLKVKRALSQEERDGVRAQWKAQYSRRYNHQHELAVLDGESEYQKIGSGLNELSSQEIRMFTETRITMVFGVPGLIIYDYAGLEKATYSNLQEAWKGFWTSNLKPMLNNWSTFLSRSLLTKFVNEELILSERIRLAWDLSEVEWLKESENERQARARENMKAGGITVNEFREIANQPLEPEDYYLRPFNVIAQPVGQVPDVAEPTTTPPTTTAGKNALGPGALKLVLKGQKAGRDVVARRMERDVKALLLKQYRAVATAVEAA